MYRHWTPAEDNHLREHYPHQRAAVVAQAINRSVSAVYARAAHLGLSKSAAFYESAYSGRTGHNNHGASTRFKKGHTTWNKGKTGWDAGGRSAETRFKKGRPAHTAHNYQPIGSSRINRDGHLERKVTDDPTLVPSRRWTPVYRLVWESAHGAIPPGHVVRWLPGMATAIEAEITADKLECISKAEHASRNTIHRYPREVKQVIRLNAKLKRKLKARAK